MLGCHRPAGRWIRGISGRVDHVEFVQLRTVWIHRERWDGRECLGDEVYFGEVGAGGTLSVLFFEQRLVCVLARRYEPSYLLRQHGGDADDEWTNCLHQRQVLVNDSTFQADLLRYLWVEDWWGVGSHYDRECLFGRGDSGRNYAAWVLCERESGPHGHQVLQRGRAPELQRDPV